ncbi:MAG: DNA alkylation repair protein [Bacteroidia bacterium]
MADALKDMFNKKFYESLAVEFNKADKNFHPDKFVKQVTKNIEPLSLNQRLRNTTVVLKEHLPADYKKAVEVLFKVVPQFSSHYTSFLFPDYIGQYGHDDFDLSMAALKFFTQHGSSEFAIREFLKRDFNKTIKVMNKWADDKNYHVRRLASEGSRARLPWSFNLDEVMKNPEVTRSILEKLKQDDELYVRKSVANHLNDFSKKNTKYMLELMNSWDKTNPHTAWIIKHASRTLIKKGHPDSLAIFDFEKNAKVKIEKFKIEKSKIKMGENLQFDFEIVSDKTKLQKLVIDYAIHYQKKSGELLAKVFKLKELNLKPKETIRISKSHRFLDFTTRKHYPGKHAVEIMINGKSYLKKEFILSM